MNHLTEIVRLTDKVNATINQGTVAGCVLVGVNTLSFMLIADNVTPVPLAVAFLLISVASQLALAAVTWLRVKTIWAQRRLVFAEMMKPRSE